MDPKTKHNKQLLETASDRLRDEHRYTCCREWSGEAAQLLAASCCRPPHCWTFKNVISEHTSL